MRDAMIWAGDRGPCGAGGGGTNPTFCTENGDKCGEDMFTGFPGVRPAGMRGKGCVMDGTKAGCWNDWAGESEGEGDGLRDELARM